MSIKNILIGAGALALGGVLFANHVAVGLSSLFGYEIVDKIVFVESEGLTGVPAFVVGGEDETYELTAGDSFKVMRTDGVFDTVTFDAADFVDIQNATLDEVADAVSAQLTVAQFGELNGFLTFTGLEGGADASLTLANLTGLPLEDLQFTPDTTFGTKDIEFTISVPAPEGHGHGGDHGDGGHPASAADGGDHGDGHGGHEHPGQDQGNANGLAGKRYVLVLSTTEGATGIGGLELPVAFDATTALGLRATNLGLLPGFVGKLNENEDEWATFPSDLLPLFFPEGNPESLYFAYAVFDFDLTPEYVSNRFEVRFVD